MDEDQAEDEGRAAGVAADQQPAGALAGADDEDDGQPDRGEDVEDRRREVGAGALLEPKEGQQVFEHRQHPEAADRDPPEVGRGAPSSAVGRLSSASEIGPAKGRAISAAAVANQKSAAKDEETTAAGSSSSL